MKPDVLEQNLRALLRRSYVPALPAPHFRDQLETLFLNEVAGRAPRRARPAPRPWLLVALVAAVLATLLGWRFFASGGPLTRERLLQRGEVALGLSDGRWRAADEEERFHGLRFEPPTLVVVTPERVELELLVAGGRVHLGARAELVLERRDGDDFATLHAGTARFHAGAHAQDLELGVPLALRAGAAPGASALAGRDAPAAQRERVAEVQAPRPSATAAATRALTGQVVDAATGAPLTDFTVALLRERLGHETALPLLCAVSAATDGRFRWQDPPAGKQRVYVHATGYALCALGEFDLSGALPELRVGLERGVSVRGRVLDAQGAPLADALVLSEQEAPTDGLLLVDSELYYWLPIAAHSGPDGRFELAHLNPGKHTLRASAAGFAVGWAETRAPAAPQDELVLTLGHGGTIEGTVTRDDGAPWAEAQIVVATMDDTTVRRTNFALARTDADGHYRVEHLPAATLIVVLMRSDKRPDVRPVQVAEGLSARADFGPVEHSLTLSGLVRRADGTPLANQTLGLFDHEKANWNQEWVASTTLADGSYAFPGVRPGRYFLYLIDEMGRGLRCIDGLEVPAGANEARHDVRLSDSRLTLTTFDARSAEPTGGVALIAMRLRPGGGDSFAGFGLSDEGGSFTFEDLQPGTYRVTGYPTNPELGYATSERIELLEGREHASEVELALEEGGALTVRVRTADGQPLEHALVSFRDESGADHQFSRLPMTDAEGRYRAAGLRPGRYQLSAELPGYASASVALRFDLGREPEIPVVLTPLAPR